MIRHLKNWWRLRAAKHYLKNYWHLIADIVLVVLVLELLIALIFIKSIHIPPINVGQINHVDKNNSGLVASSTNSDLSLKAIIPKENIYSGQKFVINIHLENRGDQAITNLTLTPQTAADFSVVKLESTDTPNNLKVEGNKLSLENLSPGSTSDTELWVTLLADPNSARYVSWYFNASYLQDNVKYQDKFALSDLKLITDLKVAGVAYYNSPLGDQLGSGPIPPIVGLPTNYWIFFNVDNKGNDLKGLTVTANLPSGVTLSNQKTLSAGEFSYNESQKRITWLVKDLSIKNPLYQAGFEVQLMPTSSQISTLPLLLTNISYIATDAYTGEQLSGKIAAIDTSLPADGINHGQGSVTK